MDSSTKLRYSKQREQIYEYLCASKAHPSADMIYEDLRGEISNLSLGTVYRNLKLLESLGKIQRVATFQNVERYDARCDSHAHFLCERCGRVYDLSVVREQVMKEACGVADNVLVRQINVNFGGVCEHCRQTEKSSKN